MKHREIVDDDNSADIVPEEVEDANEEVSDEKVDENTENEQLLNNGESQKETEKDEIEEIAAVETRVRQAQEELEVPELQAIKVTPQEFRDIQKADDDLQKYWEFSKHEQQESEGKAVFVERMVCYTESTNQIVREQIQMIRCN